MGWTKVAPVVRHNCDRPYHVGDGVVAGDVIRCDCGQHWKCTGSDWGMQWDPYPRGVLLWEKCAALGSADGMV